MVSPKYLYLTHPEWANAWVDGGPVPLNVASSYLSDARLGTLTPDETLIQHTNMPTQEAREHYTGVIDVRAEFRHMTIAGVGINGKLLPTFTGSHYTEDGLILCMSNCASSDIQRRLGKSVCLHIDDVMSLKSDLDQQVGAASIAGDCVYTFEHTRNPFVKSIADHWMQEFRLYWPNVGARRVIVPRGTAVVMSRPFTDA